MIPKIIHQIWIGPKVEPTAYLDTWRKDYLAAHPDYQYQLWREKDIATLSMDEKIKELYHLEKRYDGKADIARYYILKENGGIYIDADTVWVNRKSLDPLLEASQDSGFFAAIGPHIDLIANGVIGSVSHHPVLDHMINRMLELYPNYTKLRQQKSCSHLTGAYILSEIREKDFNYTLFPTKYFYPYKWRGIKDPKAHLKKKLPEESYMFQYGITTNHLKYEGVTFN